MSKPEQAPSVQREIERIGRRFGTLNLVDQLIIENEQLRRELSHTTKRLRDLQLAVHYYLSGEKSESVESEISRLVEEEQP